MKEANSRLIEEKRDLFLQKQREDEKKLHLIKEKQQGLLIQKQKDDFVRKAQKQENLTLLERSKDEKNAQTLEKIKLEAKKTDDIKREKELLMINRRELQKQMMLDKQRLLEQFEKLKQGKIDPKVFQNQIKEKTPEITPSQSETLSTKEKIKKKPVKIDNKPKVLKEDAEKLLEDLKLRLNSEMMGLLEEEQEKEVLRDKEDLNEISEETRKTKEKRHGVERALAQKRIEDLSR